MDASTSQTQPAPDELEAAIAEARSLAREQVAAAWQLHIDRVREQLESGWRESIDEIFDARFADIESRLRTEFDEAVSERASRHLEDSAAFARVAARRSLTEELNQIVRRLEQAESRETWIRTLLESTADYCGVAALFLITSRGLQFQGARGVEVPANAPAAEVPLTSAPAFANAIEAADTVVTAGSPKELSQTVVALLGDASERRVYLFPVVVRRSPVAVLYAEASREGGDDVNVSALELLIALASSSIGITETTTVRSGAASDLFRIENAAGAPKASAKPSWAELSKSEQEVHLKAQRFARTQVAQLLLHRVNQVRQGRASSSLYEMLKEDIDAGRESFREQFLGSSPSMVDYYHLELVRTLAKDNYDLLGSSYPGPMVS